MNVDFTTEARQDLFEAAEYYENRQQGLGKRFRNEISTVLNLAANAPLLWRERKAGYRRVNCPVFPYYIAYVIREEVLIVVAVAHGSREPGFWHGRLRE
jgi:plasmid stabilization system protein ParE